MRSDLARKAVVEIYRAALSAADPYGAVRRQTERMRLVYLEGGFRRIVVAGFGKAVCPMAKAVEDSFGSEIQAGIAITKYGHQSATGALSRIKVMEGGHPIPDANGLFATRELTGLLAETDETTLVACLISGGASALLVAPAEGITLDDKRVLTGLLLNAGADIHELNAVRKHISRVKGGRLAEIAYPSKIVSLILSDVIGDRIDVIASGPTSHDPTTFCDAMEVLEKYGLTAAAPHSVIQHLVQGVKGIIPETPKEGSLILERVENIVVGSSGIALRAARDKAADMGFCAETLTVNLAGEAKNAGQWLAGKVKSAKARTNSRPLCLISGGETTVTVRGEGTGGRNMELALAFAIDIAGEQAITLLSSATDGTDGPTEAAGAIVDGSTVREAMERGLNPQEFLDRNDSYGFFSRTNGLFVTGPTGTNVMDIQIAVIL